jgi:hypothetical protein
MSSSYTPDVLIYVYLFQESCKYINSNDNKITSAIEKDTSTHITYVPSKNPYYKIMGGLENVHKARILLNELEKNIYRESYLNKI